MKKIFCFAVFFICYFVQHDRALAQCNTVTKNVAAPVPFYHYNLALQNSNPPFPNACTNDWRTTGYLTETYTFCWVTNDGTFYRTDAANGSPLPNTDVSSSTFLTKEFLFTGVANRKGDDNDTKKLCGGYTGATGGSQAYYNTYSTTQNNLSPSYITRIQNDYGSDLIAKTDEVLLIITINNDADSLTGGDLLPLENYRLKLSHSNTNITYAHGIHGELPNILPNGDNSYFEFAAHTNGPNNTLPLNWNVVTPSSGKEKNIYCLLTITNVPPCDDNQRVLDTFTVVLFNTATGVQVAGSKSKYIARIGNSHDPNIIEVNHPTSLICGKQEEELEYTIHFQNIGMGPALSVVINLEADPSLDPTTIRVQEATIGYDTIRGTNSSWLSSIVQNSMHLQGGFNYTMQPRGATASAVANDATFTFSGISLAGIDASDIELSKGYVKFLVKTRNPYSVIHNRAGIVFDRNPEIVTNLATTTCMEDSDCASELEHCEKQLKECKSHGRDGMYWLGWIIAGIELLLLIFVLLRRRK